ncbi:MAG: HNH endonuclease [Acidobacteriaceae bacterium]|nr:HNH endonuclease [Acidobacteriaceae bacterium]MBV9294074.1 HNH endonuclease [Acidobacteriaceae bacterium]MBV9766131.1 HNH endonuclease [Acidobacteriaceae bacterium]
MNASLVRQVWRRAGDRCEYCHVPAAFYPLVFHIDHIIPRQHGGLTESDNLALACLHCNRHKGPNLAGLDPVSKRVVQLFHPRQDLWSDHFEWHGTELTGRTEIGRCTIRVLAINAADFRAVREWLSREGRLMFP